MPAKGDPPGWHLDAARRKPRTRHIEVQPWWTEAAVLCASGMADKAAARRLEVTIWQYRRALQHMSLKPLPPSRRRRG